MATKTITRAEKKDAVKNIIRELLAKKSYKHNELLDETSALYVSKYEESDNINDVKGRVGSILDVMKKEGDVMEDGGAYMLKARLPAPEPTAEQTAKKPRSKKSKSDPEQPKGVEQTEKPTRKTRAKKEKAAPIEPTAPVAPQIPIAPIAPVIPVTPETAPEPIEEKPKKKPRAKKTLEAKTETAEAKETTETPVKKTRSKKVKDAPKPLEKKEEKKEEKQEEKQDEKQDEPTVIPENEPVIVPTPIPAPVSEPTLTPPPVEEPPKATPTAQSPETKTASPVFDMTALFTGKKTPSKVEPSPKTEPVKQAEAKPLQTENEGGRVELKEKILEPKQTAKPVEQPKKAEQKKPQPQEKATPTVAVRGNVRKLSQAKPTKPLTADEALKEAFLAKLRSLGGDYFEYYSVYLLERYSLRNGRRLEGLKISGGDHDGGIDGEIELTDKFGFRETIYIQAKNWNPDKGKESLWVVGETLLQQFLGACAYRQAKDGKQHCRGIFITTSRFTPDAKRMLDELSDKLVGYDGNDLFEAAKECSFGLAQRNGTWTLDEKLLSGEKAFFNLF